MMNMMLMMVMMMTYLEVPGPVIIVEMRKIYGSDIAEYEGNEMLRLGRIALYSVQT